MQQEAMQSLGNEGRLFGHKPHRNLQKSPFMSLAPKVGVYTKYISLLSLDRREPISSSDPPNAERGIWISPSSFPCSRSHGGFGSPRTSTGIAAGAMRKFA